MHNGLDISHHNGAIDWARVRADFVWCKVSEGTGNTDRTWATNRAGARAHHIPIGGYHFAQPGDPLQQARRFVALLGPASGYDLLPVLDAEVAGIDARWCDDFLHEVERQVGATPIIYTSSLGPPYVVNDAKLIRYRLWCADYAAETGRPRCKRPWAVHQHSSTGHVAGIGGNVDLNVAPDLAALLMPHAQQAHGHPTPTRPAHPALPKAGPDMRLVRNRGTSYAVASTGAVTRLTDPDQSAIIGKTWGVTMIDIDDDELEHLLWVARHVGNAA